MGLAIPLCAQPRDFDAWLLELRREARQLGIRERTLQAALAGLRPLSRVLELDRAQPEMKLTYTAYLQRVLPATRIVQGKRKLQEHAALLREIGTVYRVQPRFIVALWGVETDYGRITGDFPVIAALATLAYAGRRRALFRRELIEALRIVDAGHIRPEAMRGSWAGAMGQLQFLPSSFRRFAVDYDGDGRRDIWRSLPDVFASIANYLARLGWHQDQTWGRRVTIPARLDPALVGLQVRRTLSQWQALGVRRAKGGMLPKRPLLASLVLPAGPAGPAFLVYDNFRILLRWNRSVYFALAVGQLADQLYDRE